MTLIIVCLLILETWGHSVESTFENGRVIGGSSAPDKAYPYQISIWRQGWGYSKYICGGSIIGDRHVLTAAHCVSGAVVPNLRVVAGTNKLRDSEQTNYTVSEAIVHKDYVSFLYKDDIAILKLNETIVFNDRIQPVRLTKVAPPSGTNCTLTGWGLTSRSSARLPDQLQYISLKTISLFECKLRLLLSGLLVGREQICTRTKAGEGSCNGDSGGPLVDTASGAQIGVVSWGHPCALGVPDVYTNVYEYRDWISKHTDLGI